MFGETESEPISVSATGSWLITDTVSTTMILKEGEQILRFSMLSDPTFFFDKIEIKEYQPSGTDTSSSDTTGLVNDLFDDDIDFVVFQDVNNLLHLNYSGNEDLLKIQIFDINGRMMKVIHGPVKDVTIHFEIYETGLYFIRATSASKLYFMKTTLFK